MPPGLHLHRAPRVESLADALALVLRAPASDDAFAPDVVIAPGRALERLVRLHVAQGLGVCANLRVTSPSTWFAGTLARLLGLEAAEVQAWEAESLAWAVHAALPALLDDPRFADVRGYLGHAAPGGTRWMGLARRVAGCFERYQLARPALVGDWDAGGGEGWQPVLWRAVRERLARPHLAELAGAARALLAREGAALAREQRPARLAWITHAGIAPAHLGLFAALARAGTEAHLLALQPVRDGAGAAHPLARSLGRQSRELDLVLDACGVTPVAVHDHAPAVAGDSALAVLQRDLLAGTVRGPAGEPPLVRARLDDSVRVLACHGRTRQVEELRDELLRRLEADPTLEPRDVVVLVPDLATWAPLVDAVFARDADALAPGEPPPLPWRVVDRPRQADNDVATALLAVMRAAPARLDAAVLLDLLSLPAVAARWGFDDEARELLAGWLAESGARWAIDADDRARHGAPPTPEHTLRFGLDRLLLGVAVPDDDALCLGAAPCEVTEGSGAELVGRVAAACEAVFDAVRALAHPRPMAEWRAALAAMLGALAAADDADHAWQAQAVRDALDELADAAEQAGAAEPVEAGAVRLALEARFGEAGSAGAAENGGVTFCALLPGRAAGARVVALLGMDDGAFPRERARLGFDLVARAPEPGDADPGEDDRARMLEAIVGARDALVVTYTGRSLDRNEPLPPAVPVSELLDALDATFALPDDARGRPVAARALLERVCPLQPFSPRCFVPGDDGRPASFERGWAAGARRLSTARVRPPAWLARPLPAAPVRDHVTVDALARWLQAPARALCEARLGVRLDEWIEVVETREPESLARRARDRYRAELVEATLAGAGTDGRMALARARGVLPHGTHAVVTHHAVADEARLVAGALAALRAAGEPLVHEVDLVLGGVRLTGRTGECRGGVQLRHHVGPLWDAELLGAWLRHLVLLAATGRPHRSVVVAHGEPAQVAFAPVDAPRERLAAIVARWQEGQQERVPLFADTSRAYAAAWRKGGDDATRAAEALRRARIVWAGSEHKAGERDRDAHVQRVWGDWAPGSDAAVDARFAELALQLWGPALDAMEEA